MNGGGKPNKNHQAKANTGIGTTKPKTTQLRLGTISQHRVY